MTLKRALRWSLGLHLIIVIFVFIKTLIFPSHTPKPFIPSLRVDMVGLPEHLKNAPPPLESQIENAEETTAQEETPKKNEKKTPTLNKHTKPSSFKKTLARLNALEKIKEWNDEEEENIQNKTQKRTKFKGNKLSTGTSLSGNAKEKDELSYLEIIKNKLNHHWTLPVWLARQEYSAQVLIYIDAVGKLRGYHFTKNSGNTQFDAAVKQALESSTPFPTPPTEIRNFLQTEGILVGFPL